MGCEAAPDEDAEVEPGAVPPGWPAPLLSRGANLGTSCWAPGKHRRHLVVNASTVPAALSRAQHALPAARVAKVCRAGLCQANDPVPTEFPFLPAQLPPGVAASAETLALLRWGRCWFAGRYRGGKLIC